MTNTLVTLNWDNIDHIMAYAIGPEVDDWNNVRHSHHLSQQFDLGRHLTRTQQDFYSNDGHHVVNWIPRRIQRITLTIYGYLLSHTTPHTHPIYDFISLLRARWYNLQSNTPTSITIPEQHRFTMYFATLGDSDHTTQRYGFNITEALHYIPIQITISDENGDTHYDDYGRPCPYNWPHGRHWQWAPHNIATTYFIPLSKRQTFTIRRLVAHDEWDNQSNNRMITEIIDHSNDITYILLAGDTVTSPPRLNMSDLHASPRINQLLSVRSPIIHTTLARSGYNRPRLPRIRNNQHFADIFISFPRHIQEPRDNPPKTLLQALHTFTTRPYVDNHDALHDTALYTDRHNNPTDPSPGPTNHTGRMIEIMVQISPLETSPDTTHTNHTNPYI